MRSLVLGTAGHIDHGKTALVKALTGVETDRLAEEKERGITIDLGFAELVGPEVRLGVVDVPGHEGFVRNMLAGATGMDVALLVVAADEGVMPQTREHLQIVRLLGVRGLVVALTKIDLVEPEWLELVDDEVGELLADTPWPDAPRVGVSSATGEGVDDVREALFAAAATIPPGRADDVVALPVDRVFTVRGTGTVVTGTLVSGTLTDGARVHLVPGELEGRVRGLQRHGEAVERAGPGARVAVALAGDAMDLDHVGRGQLLTTDPSWTSSSILTAHLAVLADTGWRLEHNQRVRVHLGTTEVMARVVVPGGDEVPPGSAGWVQLRTETPVAARSGQPVVVRSYSPLTTIAGGRVVEPDAPKRGGLDGDASTLLEALRTGAPAERIEAALALAGWGGVPESRLSVVAGVTPAQVRDRRSATEGTDGSRPHPVVLSGGSWVGAETAARGRRLIVEALRSALEADPWRRHLEVEVLRSAVPDHAAPGLADALLTRLVAEGGLEIDAGRCRPPGHEARLTPRQEALLQRIVATYREAGLAPPLVDELDPDISGDPLFAPFVARLQDEGHLARLDEGMWIDAEALADAVARVRTELAGASGLGPSDFREVLPLTRKHLLPILNHMDGAGVTRRESGGRTVLT